jgi:hypothetical protein
MPEAGRGNAGFSPEFLAEVVREIALVEKRIDQLDAHIERLKSPAAKDRVSEQRAQWAGYLRFLREQLLR